MRKLSESIDMGLRSFHYPRHLIGRDFLQAAALRCMRDDD